MTWDKACAKLYALLAAARLNAWWRGAFVFLVLAMLEFLCLLVSWLSGAKLNESSPWIITAVLIAAFAGLMRDVVTAWIVRPFLRVVYKHERPFCDKAALPVAGGTVDAFYFRFLVFNDGGAAAAKNVQVFLMDIQRKEGNAYKPFRTLSMNLRWSYLPEIPVLGILSSGMHRYCDIARVMDPHGRIRSTPDDVVGADPSRILFSFETEFPPESKINIIEPGEYRLTVFVGAENHTAAMRAIDVNVIGQWLPDTERFLNVGVKIEPFEWKLY
jgi:hypothetical protein